MTKLTDPSIVVLGAIPDDNDLIHVVDVSDTTHDPAGTSKKNTYGYLKNGVMTDDGTDVLPTHAGRHLNMGSGGFKDTNVTTAILLGDVSNTSFNTTNKTIVGAVNEIYASGVTWGETRTGTSGVGLTHTIGDNAAVGTQSMKTVISNTQTIALSAYFIDLGTASVGHAGINISARNENVNTRAINIDMGGSPGTGVHVGGNDDYIGFSVGGGTIDAAHIGYRYISTLAGSSGTSFYTDVNVSGSTVHTPFYANVQSSQENLNRTTDLFTLLCTRPHQNGVVRTDNFNMMYIKRTVTGIGSFSQGSVVKFENSSASVTDTVEVVKVIQNSNSTGLPISITQNAIVSANFKKVIGETITGNIVWISDGTNPNGTLSGTAGDICLNGVNNKTYYCTGTTNWSTSYNTTEADNKYFISAGISGGQTATGGTDANDKLTLNSTSNATKGGIEVGAGDTLTFVSGGATINEYSIDGTLAGNSDTALPTEKAVKTYVDGHSANGMWDRTGTTISVANAGDTLDFSTAGKRIDSVASVLSVVAATGITPVNDVIIPVVSSGVGDVNITANPQIAAGTAGQRLTIIGTDNQKTVTLDTGNGLALNNGQSFTLGLNDTIEFVSYNSLWIEIARSDNT